MITATEVHVRGAVEPVASGARSAVGMGSINSFNSFETLCRETLLRHGRRVDTLGTFYPE